MSATNFRDIVALILKLHVQSGAELSCLEENQAFIANYLNHLELFDPNFDNLSIVECGKELLLKHMDIDSGSMTDREIAIGDFVKRKGIEAVKASLLLGLQELTESVNVDDLRYSDNKKRKRNDLFQPFNFDDYPPYEPVDIHIENLRYGRDVISSLTFLLTVDINDFRGHYLWPDLLGALKATLNNAAVSEQLLVLTICFRFMQGFSEERQSIDLVNCILEYLGLQWATNSNNNRTPSEAVVKVQFALFDQCLRVPLQIMMEITTAESTSILSNVFGLLAKGMIAMANTVVPARVALVQTGGIKFCSHFFGFLRKLSATTVMQHFRSSSLSSVLVEDLSSSDVKDNALFRYFARHIVQSVDTTLLSRDLLSSEVDFSFVCSDNKSVVIDTLHAYVNNEFLSMARQCRTGAAVAAPPLYGSIVSLWINVNQVIEWDTPLSRDLVVHFLSCFDHLSSIDSSAAISSILTDAVVITQDLLQTLDKVDDPSLVKMLFICVAKLWSNLVARWSEHCASPELHGTLHKVVGSLQRLNLICEVTVVRLLNACASVALSWKELVLSELLAAMVTFFGDSSNTDESDDRDDRQSRLEVMQSTIPSLVALICSCSFSEDCKTKWSALMAVACSRLAQDKEYYEESELLLLDLLRRLVCAGHFETIAQYLCQGKPAVAFLSAPETVTPGILASLCLEVVDVVDSTDAFMVDLLCLAAANDKRFYDDCIRRMDLIVGSGSKTAQELSEILLAFITSHCDV